MPAHSSACLFTFVLFIYTGYLSIHLYSAHLSSYFKFTTCSDSWDKAHSTRDPSQQEIATCTTLPFLSGYQKWASKLFPSPQIVNPQIWLIRTWHTAQLCLKTILQSKRFVYSLYFVSRNVFMSGLAVVLSPQITKNGPANSKSAKSLTCGRSPNLIHF